MDPSPTLDEQAVLRHARFLRGLAGSLVADPASADDAVQEAWLAALRRRPDASRPLEPWLARVVRNTLGRLRRGAARRAERERRAARPEAMAGAEASLERAKRLREVLDEVLTLPEAEREVVLLRYYEALAPREIAARLAVPVEVVYRRLEHALALLRARFDARHPEGRRSWCVGLAGALGLPHELLAEAPAAALAAAGAAAGATSTAGTVSVVSGALIMASSTSPLVVAALSLGAGLGLGWVVHEQWGPSEPTSVTREASEEARPADPLSAERSAEGAASPSLRASEAAQREARYESELRTLRQKNVALSAELETARKAMAQAAPVDPKALRFGLSGPTPIFDQADWGALAGHVAEMNKVMPRLRDDLAAGRDLSADVTHELQEHNMPLATFAVGAAQELKGTGPNGAYTHPAVLANLIRAALLAANDALTPAQELTIVALGNDWVADAERSAQSVAADAPALARTIVEVDAKQRFLDAVKLQLTASQRAVLFHPETEGRLGLDLLSPALVYMLHSGVYGTSAEDLATKLGASLLQAAGAKDLDPAALLGVAQRWLDDVPGAATPRAMRDTENMFPTVQAMQAYARAQVAAIERAVEGGRLTPEQVAKLKRSTTVVTPQVLAPS